MGSGVNYRPNSSDLQYHLLKYHKDIATAVMTKHREKAREAAKVRSDLHQVKQRTAALEKKLGAVYLPQTNLREATDVKTILEEEEAAKKN